MKSITSKDCPNVKKALEFIREESIHPENLVNLIESNGRVHVIYWTVKPVYPKYD